MANKKSPASGWPVIQGDYISGSAESCVAVCSFGSHLDEQGVCDAGAAICGSCKTENLGLEKLIANTISNPNIRFIVFCGTEVKGHLSGQSLKALHENGVEGGKIVGSNGAIAFIENLDAAAIGRFQEQVEIIDIMESEDMGAITAKINECAGKDPGAFDADPMVIEVSADEGGAESTEGVEAVMSAELALIHARMKTIQMMVTDMGYRNRYAAGVYSGKVEGVMIGLIVSFVLLGFLLMG
ncbi:tetrahydromethanopterin S-methyltransferase subunit A [Methanogenium sp. MK-MG]|uniref:tetrahydromethanopterin S-methyltransferase subunit A n=1 Tax=Methanogenium sp. MK-MG TaxID=2599926 RepID=UPI0013ECC2E4|nr:tetrahydromethanopterin S-methyltransferase subunit A [Methanogenium sp. MK-MG]KAF1073470.1 Tetrahydromethanopterin S-methyltransferase subunit A 1 [Methanogenium sp. MK-MG]